MNVYRAEVRNMRRKMIRLMLSMALIVALLAAPLSAQAAGNIMILKTTVDYGRLREGPSSAYNVITSLAKGERLFFAGQTSEAFCYVCTSHGQMGYIYSGFLKPYGWMRTDMVYRCTQTVGLFKRPTTSGGYYTGLPRGELVLVFQTNGGWAFAKTLNGQGGFIPLSCLQQAA